MSKLTYACVGGPPDDWMNLMVIDLKTGEEVREVIEVNTKEGWLRRHVLDAEGRPRTEGTGDRRRFMVRRYKGRFEIRRRV